MPCLVGRLIGQAGAHQEARRSNAGGAQAPDHTGAGLADAKDMVEAAIRRGVWR